MIEERMEKRMGDMENNKEHWDTNMDERIMRMENNMVERIVKLTQNLEGKLPNDDDVVPGTQEDKDSDIVDQPSINKPNTRGFDSNNGIN